MEKLKALINANIPTFQLFVALSAIHLGFTIALSLAINHNMTLLVSLLSTLLAAPLNILNAIIIKKYFIK